MPRPSLDPGAVSGAAAPRGRRLRRRRAGLLLCLPIVLCLPATTWADAERRPTDVVTDVATGRGACAARLRWGRAQRQPAAGRLRAPGGPTGPLRLGAAGAASARGRRERRLLPVVRRQPPAPRRDGRPVPGRGRPGEPVAHGGLVVRRDDEGAARRRSRPRRPQVPGLPGQRPGVRPGGAVPGRTTKGTRTPSCTRRAGAGPSSRTSWCTCSEGSSPALRGRPGATGTAPTSTT